VGFYDLTDFEKELFYFKTRVETIISLEIGDKIDADTAYKEIKSLMKELKKVRKQHKDVEPLDNWEGVN
jgi:hypothetical protein